MWVSNMCVTMWLSAIHHYHNILKNDKRGSPDTKLIIDFDRKPAVYIMIIPYIYYLLVVALIL